MPEPLQLPEKDAIQAQLDRILASTTFAPHARLREFLRFVVESTLQGLDLKESLIGVGVFGKDAGWDSQSASVVRTTANRLRKRLTVYYRTEGLADPVLIELETGTYVPQFTLTSCRDSDSIKSMELPAEARESVSNPKDKRQSLVLSSIFGLLLTVIGGAWFGSYGIAILALSFSTILALLVYAQSSDTILSRAGISLLVLADMAYIPSASTLPGLADGVVNISTLTTAIAYPFITGLKFIPLFVLVLACWTSLPLWESPTPQSRRISRTVYLGSGVLALGLTALSILTLSADGRMWHAKLPGWQTLLLGYAWIYGINGAVWLSNYHVFEKGSGRLNRSVLLYCGLAYALLAPGAFLVDHQYNEINRYYLDKRRPEAFRVTHPDAIARFRDERQSEYTGVGPDLAALLSDPSFRAALRGGVFYRQNFDEPFQIINHAVMFGYRTSVGDPKASPQFVTVRFPRELAEALNFQPMENLR